MAWGFDAVCPDCGHNWKAIEVSLHLGPRPYGAEHTQTLFCSHCCIRLCLPRLLDRKAWRHWYERFLAESQFRPEWVMHLLAHIDAGFVSYGWYTPRLIDPGVVNCSGCGSPMVPSIPSGNHVACPSCQSLRPVLVGATSHIILDGPTGGFG